jgi:hypothetical protein
MRAFVICAALVSLGLSTPVLAAAGANPTMKQCADQWQAMKKAGTAKGSYRDFSKSCLAGKTGPTSRAPAQTRMQRVGPQAAPRAAAPKGSNADAAGATARCKDGAYSHAKGHAGACSHHGGVAQWLK